MTSSGTGRPVVVGNRVRGRSEAVDVGTNRGGVNVEGVGVGRGNPHDGLGPNQKWPDVEGTARPVRWDKFLVGENNLLNGLDELVFRVGFHQHSLGRVSEPLGVFFGAE